MKRWLGVAVMAGLAALAIGSPTSASGTSNPWQDAAARVDFPLYKPTVTLGFKLGPIRVPECGYGNEEIHASYSNGAGKKAPQFGFSEAYPQFCGDGGESMTVASIDVNGVKVPVAAYCYPKPKCTVQDGFDNGFTLQLRGSGAKRTRISAWSSHLVLDDLAKVVRSLTRVSTPPPGSPTASTVSGRCSKSTALRVATELRLGVDSTLPNPIASVLCGPFTGPGSQAMVATFAQGTCLPSSGWAVFRSTGGAWQLVMERRGFSTLAAAGSDIRETVPVYRPGDSRCFPEGGTKTRTWRWNGSRLVASPWQKGTKEESDATSPMSARRAFYSPSGNLWCDMVDRGNRGNRYAGVTCSSRKPERVVSMGLDARLTICQGAGCIGNAGEDPQPDPTLLGYGQQMTVGRLRCLSLQIGFKCTVISSGRGFLINRDGVRRVGS